MARIAVVVLSLASMACAQPDLSAYFGFAEPRTIVVDDGCGPLISADMNGDGRPDLVIVNNAKVNDRLAVKIARDIAQEIERELTYPGEVRVTLVRETRVVEYAR